MPFTGAHPLAVAPILRVCWLDPTALVIGSMAPDFQYFVYGHERGTLGHSMLGLVAWCIPVVVIAGLIFHRVVKWPLLVAAPAGVAARLFTAAAAGWPVRPVAIAVSAVIGGVTHDLWDSCTHSDGFIVSHFPGLFRWMIDIPGLGEPMVLHRLLQYACSLVGVIAVAALVARAVRRRLPVELPPLPRWRARLVFLGAILVGCGAVGWHVRRYLYGPTPIVVACVSGMLAGVLVASVALHDVGLCARSVSGRRDT